MNFEDAIAAIMIHIEEAAYRGATKAMTEFNRVQLVDTATAITTLKIGKDTLREYREAGMPHIKAGKGYKYDLNACNQWISENL